MNKKNLRVIELFAGIGAPRKALMRGEYNFQIVDTIEIDPKPIASYNAIYDEHVAPQSIVDYHPVKEEIGEIDLIWNSSPCQDFSVAGKGAGGVEGSGTRSSLIYEVIRLVKEIKPKYVIWENVKGLTTNKHRPILDDYIKRLDELGYRSCYQVLNAKDYGIPQNRERVFVVSIRNDIKQDFTFPTPVSLDKTFYDYLDNNDVDDSVILSQNDLLKVKDFGAKYSFGGSIAKTGVYGTITASYGKVSGNSNKVPYNDTYRILTPKECWRLMGFDDADYIKASQVNTKSQLYKEAGNSVVVNVIEAIFDNLLKEYK